MLKKELTVGIILIFILSSLIPMVSSFENKINNATEYNDVYSFHVNISEPKYWYAIKMETNTTVNISIYNKKYLSTMINDTPTTRGIFGVQYAFDKDKNFLCIGSTTGYNFGPRDRYFQIDLGPINYSYYNFYNSSGVASRGSSFLEMSRLSGTWYFLFIWYSAEGYNDIYFNTSKPVNISTTQGTNTFFYQREDFYGKLNTGWSGGTIIFNGEKRINVENNLFARFKPFMPSDILFIKYINPMGYSKWLLQIGVNRFFSAIFEKAGPAGYWKEDIMNGMNGEWIFKANIFGVNKLYYPNIGLYGADVKLPD